MSKKTGITLPARFAKAEVFINFLIANELTPTIGFDVSKFNYLMPKNEYLNVNKFMRLSLSQDVIKNMVVKNDYINVTARFENDLDKKINISILFDSITDIGCLESRTLYNFPEDDYELNVLDYMEKEDAFKRLEETIKNIQKSSNTLNEKDLCVAPKNQVPALEKINNRLGSSGKKIKKIKVNLNEENDFMKKNTVSKCYKGKATRNRKTSDSVINGELFNFEVEITRKDRKIYIKETSNARTVFSMVTESVREDTKDNVMLLKCHLISEFLKNLERGFDRLENPIGGKKIKTTANDNEFKKAKQKNSG